MSYDFFGNGSDFATGDSDLIGSIDEWLRRKSQADKVAEGTDEEDENDPEDILDNGAKLSKTFGTLGKRLGKKKARTQYQLPVPGRPTPPPILAPTMDIGSIMDWIERRRQNPY